MKIPQNARLLAVALLVFAGCGTAPSSDHNARLITKADDYYSVYAYEYLVSGVLPINADANVLADPEKRQRAAEDRVAAFVLYLNRHISTHVADDDESNGTSSADGGTDTEEPEEQEDDGKVTIDGHFAQVRNQLKTVTVEPVEGQEGAYQAKFSVTIAGAPSLLNEIPGIEVADYSTFTFPVPMPKDATGFDAHYNLAYAFDAAKYQGELEQVMANAKAEDVSNNAYAKWDKFVEDGVLTLTIINGWDYHDARSDLEDARAAFDKLVELGFEAPAESFEQLKADSGPFTKQIRAGKPDAQGKRALIQVEVRLFHSDMFMTNREAERDNGIAELVSRDIFVFNGHTGAYYGYIFGPDYDLEIKPTDIAALPFEQRHQLIFNLGCKTYSQYADAIYANANKTTENTDIITTVNYAIPGAVAPLLDTLLTTTTADDGIEEHFPTHYQYLLSQLDAATWEGTFHGVHGVDDNPHVHPYFDMSKLGEACGEDSECGGLHFGGLCSTVDGQDGKQCVARTTYGCPEGSNAAVLDGNYIACVKAADNEK